MANGGAAATAFNRLRSALRRLVWPNRQRRRDVVSTPAPAPAPDAGDLRVVDSNMLRGWNTLLESIGAENRELENRLRSGAAREADLAREAREKRIEAARFASALAALGASQRSQPAPPPVPPDVTDDYGVWLAATRPSDAALRLQRDMSRTMDGPVFSVIVPVYKLPLAILRETIDSVRAQTWDRWELCIAHGDNDDVAAREWLERLADTDPRVKVRCLDANGGISANSNAALELATGEFIVLLDHDDLLEPHALFAIASRLLERPDTDLVYSDKDKTDAAAVARFDPLFKPEWSPEAMLTVNYLTHVNALRTSVVREIGGWRSVTDGAQDWDLFFRFVRCAPRVETIRDVLYRWRIVPSSVASGTLDSKPYALRAQMVALESYLHELGVDVTYGPDERDAVSVRPHFGAPRESVAVAIADVVRHDDARAAAAARVASACPSAVTRIVVALRDASRVFDDPRIAVVADARDPGATLDRCVDAAGTEIVIVVDAEVALPAGRWVDELVGPLQIPGVGAVSPMVLDARNGEMLHVGFVFDRDGALQAPQHFMWFGSPFWMRNFSAVAGFAFAARVADVRAAGGFGGIAAYPRRDVDLCLRIGRLGRRIAYTPYVRVVAHRMEPALAAPVDGTPDGALMGRMVFPDGDPHFHPALTVVDRIVRFRLPSRALPHEEKFTAEARSLVERFDATPKQIALSRAAHDTPVPYPPRRVAWIVPDFAHAHYGGIATVLRFACVWKEQFGVEPVLIVHGLTPPDVLRQRVTCAFPALAGVEVHRISSPSDTSALPGVDAAFATFWPTAYALLRWRGAGKRCYLVQDFEPNFYPAGTTAGLAAATYRFGFEGVCNTIGLAERYAALGGSTTAFTPAIDPRVFHRRGRDMAGESRPIRIFAYMRPGHLRNGFELIAAALKTVKRRFGDGVEIFSAGSPWDPYAFGLDGVLTNLGLLGYHATGALYRSVDVGTVIMMTSHPSYLPMELMACGATVVTNYNERTGWLLRDDGNCLLAETTASALAARVADAVGDARLRRRISEAAAAEVESRYADWNGTAVDLFRRLFAQDSTARPGASNAPAHGAGG
ncbi:MAG: O-antigen biosynthesis protein [Candidatus Eremiobacteraeota bacterium]|jgi:glycosyltransferase involved in cell wall biosynthesis|nr:O-antigen biosynthesis protein [Candidatus Eremiobacteraeota bacterium]